MPRKDQRYHRIAVSQQPDILLISKDSKQQGGNGQNNKQNTPEMKQNWFTYDEKPKRKFH